jgi:AraC-like DNA-binding protein
MFLYLSGITLAFFLSFVLLTKRNKTNADYILVAWLAISGLHLLSFFLFSTGRYTSYPTLIVLGFPLPLVQGPFLYLYTRQQTSFPAGFKKRWLLHFLPVILSYLLFIQFYPLSPEQKTEVFRQSGRGFETQSAINLYAVYVSGIIYITLSLRALLKYRKSIVHQFSNIEKINFNWLLCLTAWIGIIWIAVLFIQNDKWIFACASVFILWLGYYSIRQVQVYHPSPFHPGLPTGNQENPGQREDGDYIKYQKSTLTDEDAAEIHGRLKQLMAREKPYTNPDLTLDELAKMLDVHPNYLSQIINSKENRSFYDLINQQRVEEFIQLTANSVSQQYTLLGIAYDCGFNSKASFNRNFKKYTGQTPSDYLKKDVYTAQAVPSSL